MMRRRILCILLCLGTYSLCHAQGGYDNVIVPAAEGVGCKAPEPIPVPTPEPGCDDPSLLTQPSNTQNQPKAKMVLHAEPEKIDPIPAPTATQGRSLMPEPPVSPPSNDTHTEKEIVPIPPEEKNPDPVHIEPQIKPKPVAHVQAKKEKAQLAVKNIVPSNIPDSGTTTKKTKIKEEKEQNLIVKNDQVSPSKSGKKSSEPQVKKYKKPKNLPKPQVKTIGSAVPAYYIAPDFYVQSIEEGKDIGEQEEHGSYEKYNIMSNAQDFSKTFLREIISVSLLLFLLMGILFV